MSGEATSVDADRPQSSTEQTKSDAELQPAAITGGGVNFSFTFNTVTYNVQFYSPDSHGQYGFSVTQGATVVAALTYKDDADWRIQVGLPALFKVDDHLSINTMSVDITNGTTVALG